MKKQTTILVPTYNRPEDLKRLVSYTVDNFSLDRVHMIVLDGSDKKNQKLNQNACNHDRIEYKNYENHITYVERMFSGLKKVKTDTVTILGDDDILDPNGLTDCVNFLHDNSDYAIAHGKYIGFDYAPNGLRFNETYQSQSIENNSPLERLYYFLSAYTAPTFYAVNRTCLLKKGFEELIKNNFDISDYVAAEIMVSCIPLANGKLKRLDTFFQARRFLPPTKGKYVVYAKYMMENHFSEKIGKIRNSILENMKDLQTKKDKTVLDAINYALAAFFGQRLNPQEIEQRFNQLGIKRD